MRKVRGFNPRDYLILFFGIMTCTAAQQLISQDATRPRSGKDFHTLGMNAIKNNDIDAALELFERGISAEPQYAANYYEAAVIFCRSKNPIWGIMYGEVFMNLELTGNRVDEVSKCIYDAYKNELKFNNDTLTMVTFCSTPMRKIDSLDFVPGNSTESFCNVFEPLIGACASYERNGFDVEALSRIRARMAYAFYALRRDSSHPNIVFEYQLKTLKEELVDAYNHWITRSGDASAFNAWKNEHDAEWTAFLAWQKKNPLQVSDDHRFHRLLYKQ